MQVIALPLRRSIPRGHARGVGHADGRGESLLRVGTMLAAFKPTWSGLGTSDSVCSRWLDCSPPLRARSVE